MEIRDLVLAEDACTTPTSVSRGKSVPKFDVVVNSGVDFAVRRTAGSVSKMLVMLVSQEQYYVKNERNGEIRPLDQKSLASFLSGAVGGVVHVGNEWCPDLYCEKVWRDTLLEVLEHEGFAEIAKSRLFVLGEVGRRFGTYRLSLMLDSMAELCHAHPALMKLVGSVQRQDEHINLIGFASEFAAVEDAYGLDKAREFVNRFAASEQARLIDLNTVKCVSVESLLSLPLSNESYSWSAYRRARIRDDAAGERVTFQFDKFCDYLLDESAREGFADSLGNWVETWKDDISMQILLTGKVHDKYPRNLSSHHDKLAYECRMRATTFAAEAFSHAAANMTRYDYHPDCADMFVTHPESAEDMHNEAVMQSNCLASYINRVAEGKSLILFVRKADRPDKSYLTVEVNPDTLSLVQVKASHNREADDEGMGFVAEWCERFGLKMGVYSHYRLHIAR